MSDYTATTLAGDVSGYATVVALFERDQLAHVERVAAEIQPLPPEVSICYMEATYCQVLTDRALRLFRTWDRDDRLPARTRADPFDNPARFTARALGSGNGLWLSPLRPVQLVDYRQLTAIKREWNRMDFVIEVTLQPGARAYFGRASSQRETFGSRVRVLGGGAMQVFVPRDQIGFVRTNKTWAVR